MPKKFIHKDGSETIVKCHHFQYNDKFEVERVKKGFTTVFVSVATGCNIGCKMCYLTNVKQEVPIRVLRPAEVCDNNKEIVSGLKAKNIKISFMGIGEGIFLHKDLNSIAKIIVGEKNLYGVDVGSMLPDADTYISDSLNNLHNGKFFFSLHSAIQSTRDKLIKSQVSLKVAESFMNYLTIKKVCHYLILEGLNDTKKELDSAIEFCKSTNSQLRILEFNKIGDLQESKGMREAVNYLRQNYDNVKMCYSSGKKMKAACGMFH
jgi:adenine C2-methylase RlmN of 23S rRNA A2503 and tRNA A37